MNRDAVPWFFDQYEIRARITPTIVIMSPLVLATFLVIYTVSKSIVASFSGLALSLLFVVYALTFLPRHLGKKIEPDLWASWGGSPTTRALRWRDEMIDKATKQRIRTQAEQISEVTLLSQEEEMRNPQDGDRRISQAVAQVRAVVRQKDPGGIWSKHNAEYGLNRNLMASRTLWVASAILGALMCVLVWYFYEKNSVLILGTALDLMFVPIAYVLGWRLLPRSVKEAADSYADSLLRSFLVETGSRGM